MPRHADFNYLGKHHGIFMDQAQDYMPAEYKHDYQMACDAQPTLIGAANGGIPAYFTTMVDPDVIRILTTPTKAAEIFGETKKGSWTDQTAMFGVLEATGETSAYGDYSENGMSGANVNYVSRQAFLFQTFTKYGDLEMARAGEAKINYVSELQKASATVLNRFLNKTYFYGIEGMQNYGALNDPKLSTPIAPNATGTASGTLWATKDGAAIYGDLVTLFGQLVSQSKGIIEMGDAMTLALSPTAAVNLTKTNQFNVNVTDQLKKNFPNLRVVSAVEYSTTGGELVQLIADKVDGMKTVEVAFNEKMREHAIVPGSSSWSQKKTSGTWGAIVKHPFGIAQMLGI